MVLKAPPATVPSEVPALGKKRITCENALTAALHFLSGAHFIMTCRELFALRAVSHFVRHAANDALSRVRVLTVRDLGVVIRPPTRAEDDEAAAHAQLEHAAWMTELQRTRSRRAIVIECLNHQLLSRLDSVRKELAKAQHLHHTEQDHAKAATLDDAVARMSRSLHTLERGDTAEHRCLEHEMLQLHYQDRAIGAAATRLTARLRKATDPCRFYSADASVVAVRRLVSTLSHLRTVSLAAPALTNAHGSQCDHFVMHEVDRIVLAIASVADGRVINLDCRYLAVTSSRAGLGLTGAGLGLTDAALKPASSFSRLQRLTLRGCHAITDAGVRAIMHRSPTLKALDVAYCVGISDSTLLDFRIAECRHTLTELNIDRAFSGMTEGVRSDYGPTCTDEGLVALAQACCALKVLHVRGYRPTPLASRPPLSAISFQALAQAPRSLRHVFADGTCVGEDHDSAWRALQAAVTARGGTATNLTRHLSQVPHSHMTTALRGALDESS